MAIALIGKEILCIRKVWQNFISQPHFGIFLIPGFWIITYHFCFQNTFTLEKVINMFPSIIEDSGASFTTILSPHFWQYNFWLTWNHFFLSLFKNNRMWWDTVEIGFGKLNVGLPPTEEAQWRSWERHLKNERMMEVFCKILLVSLDLNFDYLVFYFNHNLLWLLF
jgi:hypothetical protein